MKAVISFALGAVTAFRVVAAALGKAEAEGKISYADDLILEANPVTGWYTEGPGGVSLTNVHSPTQCAGRGCAIHARPTQHPLSEAPLLWRTDRGILERICKHGVSHPDYDSAQYLEGQGLGYENVHGCCGCC